MCPGFRGILPSKKNFAFEIPCVTLRDPRSWSGLLEGGTLMAIDIKLNVRMQLDEAALEDALAEFDEVTVSELIRQVLDKAIALDEVNAEVLEGPNTLEEYDSGSP